MHHVPCRQRLDEGQEEELLQGSVPEAAAGMQMLAGKPWQSQLGKGDYARLSRASCDDDRGLCQVRNCGVIGTDMSSMDIPKGMKVTMYDQTDFRGRSMTFSGPMDANKHCLAARKYQGGYFNDRVRSIKITGPHVDV